METKSKNRFSQIRINQIDELYLWGVENTTMKQISEHDIVSFFFIDRENTPDDLLNVYQIFTLLSNHAKKSFFLEDYMAREYAMTAILRQTKGIDAMEMYRKIKKNDVLISPPLSNSTKIKIIQKIISERNNENNPISEIQLIEILIQKESMSHFDAKNIIKKALELGAIIKTESGDLSL